MLKNGNGRGFTLVQMILACLLCIGVAGAAARYRYKKISAPIIQYAAHPESEALKAKYGPHRNSYSEEEWCIRDFFNDRRDGFFVDVGANDYKVTSNTYYLDTGTELAGNRHRTPETVRSRLREVPAAYEVRLVFRVRRLEPARQDVPGR